ncbi:hypothetical protein MUP79_08625 [Candidatus Bathyarchaeota archaeon]|nr:hypothetical protein [Candidatus Bathyarchaeota archaeon]
MTLPQRPATINYFELRKKIMLGQQLIKDRLRLRNTKGDVIKVTDEVVVYYGKPTDSDSKKKLVFASKGHIVNQGLIGIINLISSYQAGWSSNPGLMPSYNWTSKTTYMRVGTGGNVTTGTVTGLTTPSATAPDSQAGTASSPAGGTYRCSWTATWNAGTLTAITITEIGLFLQIMTGLQSFGQTQYGYNNTGVALFSRLSAADGDFTQFVVNTSVPLTIEWRLTLTFA